MLALFGSDLRKVGDIEHLRVEGEFGDDVPHCIGNAAGNSGVDLIENNSGLAGRASRKRLESQHNSRNLTAGSDLLDRTRGHRSIGGEQESYLVGAVGARFRRAGEFDDEHRSGHTEATQHLDYTFFDNRSGLMARGGDLSGKFSGLGLGGGSFGFEVGNMLFAVLDGTEAGGEVGLKIEKFSHGGNAVFLLESIDGIEAGRDLSKTLGITLDAIVLGSHFALQILQFEVSGRETLGKSCGARMDIADMLDSGAKSAEAGDDTGFVGTGSGVAVTAELDYRGGKGLADLVAMGKFEKFGFEELLLVGAKAERREFFGLVAQPILVARGGRCCRAGGGKLFKQRAPVRENLAVVL